MSAFDADALGVREAALPSAFVRIPGIGVVAGIVLSTLDARRYS